MLKDITFIQAEKVQSDAKLVMDWRNDPITLNNFYHQTPKVWPTFWNEFLETYFRTEPIPVFGLLNNKKAAFLKFDITKDSTNRAQKCVDISINIAPEFRGKGLGVIFLNGVEAYLKSHSVSMVHAEVKTINLASAKTFEKAGYLLTAEISKRIDDIDETIEIYQYIRNL